MKKASTIGLSIFIALIFITSSFAQEIQKVKIDFETPNGFIRHLLLGFTPDNAANDNYNYGYDALNNDDFPDDLNWIIGNLRCVIQGVGEFDSTKTYPLGMYLSNEGTYKISLNSLENFTEEINVFVYDNVEETYTKINDTNFELYMNIGEFEDRFFIAFEDLNQQLNNEDYNSKRTQIYFLNNTSEIYINWNQINQVNEVELMTILGQTIQKWNDLNIVSNNELKIPIKNTPAGNYIIRMKSSNGLINSKQVIITK